MAIIKIKAIKRSHKQTLDYIMNEKKIYRRPTEQQQAIDYIVNAEKTDEGALVSGYNCTPAFSATEFSLTQDLAKEVRGNFKKVGGADVRAYHLIQSFAPEDDITPEEVHELGKKLMEQFLEGKHEFVIATHVDKAHIHNHIVFNATSFYDLKKFRSQPYLTVSKIRSISDQLCTEKGLHVLDADQTLKSNYKMYQKYRSLTTYRVQIRQRMNFLLETATDFTQLKEDAQSLGVTIDFNGKHTTYQYGAQKRRTREDKLSDDHRFSKEGLLERLESNRVLTSYLETKIEDCFQRAASFSEFTEFLKQKQVTFKRNRHKEIVFQLFEFEKGHLPEKSLNEGYQLDRIRECFSQNRPLVRLKKTQNIQELFNDRPRTRPTMDETALLISSEIIAERTSEGLLLNVVDPMGEKGQIFIDAHHVDYLSQEGTYQIYIGPQFNYYLNEQGKNTSYFIKGEQLIRQIETWMDRPKILVELPQSLIRTINDKGVILTFEKEGIQRLFLSKEEVSIDPLSQKVSVQLSENWHYSYQRKDRKQKRSPYEAISGKQLVQLIEKNQPMLDTLLSHRIQTYQRKNSVAEAKELAYHLNLLRSNRIKDVPMLLQQMISLERQIQQTKQSLESLKTKISEYNQVAKHLVAYQKYYWVKEDQAKPCSQEKQQFDLAEKYLTDRGISPLVSTEKVIELVKNHQTQEKELHQQLQQLGEKLSDYDKINQLLSDLNKDLSREKKKTKEQERQNP